MGKKLTIHKSNQLNDLLTLLGKFYLIDKQPFQTESIVVYTRGIEEYIKKNLSSQLGVVANLNFQRPGAFFWDIAQCCIPRLKKRTNLFQPQIMLWKIFSLFQSQNFAQSYPLTYQEVNNYISKHHVAAYDLAKELATLFSHYMIYRPQWITNWSNNQLVEYIPKKEQLWQKELWLYLHTKLDTDNMVLVWSELETILKQPKLNNKIQLPKRINLFSITTLAPLYLELIDLLSNHIPVHLFTLSPCQEDWTATQLEHPLLESLGYQGREFFKILLDYPATLEQEIYEPVTDPNNLLKTIQQDILHLNKPSDLSQKYHSIEKLLDDNSLTIQSAHSPVRELQILKNYLIKYIAENPEIKLEDIAILSPKIENYLPYINGIFGQQTTDNIPLNYSVTDVKVSQNQPYYAAIQTILELMGSRFEVDKVLDLLKNELIRKKFFIYSRELGIIIFTLERLNISWGLNQAHREKYHAHNDQFTWEKGLNNLNTLLSDDLPESTLLNFKTFYADYYDNENDEIIQEIKVVLKDKLLILLETLINIYQDINLKQLSLSNWIEKIQAISLQLIHLDKDSEVTQKVFFNQLINLNKAIILAKSDTPINYITFKYIINVHTNTVSEAGFLNNGITFASLMPMRTIPFKFVALIGLNDQAFPRRNINSFFDLIQKNRLPGDLSRREDDRYLFLETLISTQKSLYLSFIGRSLQNNDALNPSPLINELIDLVASMVCIDSKTLQKQWITQHPLQNFSKRYFEKGSLLINYQQQYLDAYQENNKGNKEDFISNYVAGKKLGSILELSELLAFWKSPQRFWLKNELSIHKPWLQPETLFEEPFSLLKTPYQNSFKNKSTQLNHKGEFIVQKLLSTLQPQQNIQTLKQELFNLDYLPSGELAHIWFNNIKAQFNDLLNTTLPENELTVREILLYPKYSVTINLELENIHLNAYLDSIFNGQLVLFNNKRSTNNSLLIQAYLQHLIYSCHTPATTSYVIALKELIYFKPISTDIAYSYLGKWLLYMQQGFTEPLPLLNHSSFLIAEELLKNLTEIIKQILKNSQNESSEETSLQTNLKESLGLLLLQKQAKVTKDTKDTELKKIAKKIVNTISCDNLQKAITTIEPSVEDIAMHLEDQDDIKYFENQLLFNNEELISENKLFLPLIKKLIIPMLNNFEKIEI